MNLELPIVIHSSSLEQLREVFEASREMDLLLAGGLVGGRKAKARS